MDTPPINKVSSASPAERGIHSVNTTSSPLPHRHENTVTPMNKRIMLVDDEPQVLALLDITLRRPGFTVIKANNATHALEAINEQTPDLFVLDVMMPGMDGIELCRRIRARTQTAKVPILLVSARHDPEIVRKALAAGADDCLSKLTPQYKLLLKVRQLLGIDTENPSQQ